MKFKNYGERKNAAEQINKETGKISETFTKLGINQEKVPLKKLSNINKVVTLDQ